MTKDFTKYVLKQNPTNQKRIFKAIYHINQWDLEKLDYKKLKSFDDVFRARVRKFRIVFTRNQQNQGIILDVNTRGDIY